MTVLDDSLLSVVLIFAYFILFLAFLGMAEISVAYREKKETMMLGGLFTAAVGLLTGPLLTRAPMKELPFLSWALAQPVAFWIVLWLALSMLGALLHREHVLWRSRHLTAMSIKSAFDSLPEGVCFATKGGMPLLVNPQMMIYSMEFTGTYLNDAGKFWQSLQNMCSPEFRQDMEYYVVLERTDHRMIRFEKKEFIFDGTRVDEIVTADITDEYLVSRSLKQKRLELAQLMETHQSYGRILTDVTRKKEILNAKMNIHDRLSHVMLMTRHELESASGDMTSVIRSWQEVLDMLNTRSRDENVPEALLALEESGREVGIQIQVQGSIPEDETHLRVFLIGAMECLLNASQHAHASCLNIEIKRRNGHLIIRYVNDGEGPKGPVAEGGGLSLLREHVEEIWGTMKVEYDPQYALELDFYEGVSE